MVSSIKVSLVSSYTFVLRLTILEAPFSVYARGKAKALVG